MRTGRKQALFDCAAIGNEIQCLSADAKVIEQRAALCGGAVHCNTFALLLQLAQQRQQLCAQFFNLRAEAEIKICLTHTAIALCFKHSADSFRPANRLSSDRLLYEYLQRAA